MNKQNQSDPVATFHVYNRCCNGDRFPLPMDHVWKIMEDFLYLMHKSHDVQLISFVLMSNHYHLMLRASAQELGRAMNTFQRDTAKVINFHANTKNQVWGGRYKRTVLPNAEAVYNCYRYIYRNPVEVGLAAKVEDYRFSTLHSLLGKQKCIIPLMADPLLFDEPEARLRWLNTSYAEGDRKKIKRGLRRAVYQEPLRLRG